MRSPTPADTTSRRGRGSKGSLSGLVVAGSEFPALGLESVVGGAAVVEDERVAEHLADPRDVDGANTGDCARLSVSRSVWGVVSVSNICS